MHSTKFYNKFLTVKTTLVEFIVDKNQDNVNNKYFIKKGSRIFTP